MRDEAVAQLLGLLVEPTSGVAQRVQNRAADLFERHADLVRVRLAELMEGGNRAAEALLALITDEPSDAQLAAAHAAAEQLAAPSKNTAQSMGFGTPAISQTLLALHLPAAERVKLVRAQLDRAAAPYEFASDRANYYLAAANLADGLEDVADLFAEAIRRSDDQTPSPGDLLSIFSSHPSAPSEPPGCRPTRAVTHSFSPPGWPVRPMNKSKSANARSACLQQAATPATRRRSPC